MIAAIAAGMLASTSSDATETAYAHSAVPPDVAIVPAATLLSPEESGYLEIAPIPTAEPIPLLIGNYRRCETNAREFEICRFELVVCEDDRSSCAEVP